MRSFNDLNESYERSMMARGEPEKEETMEKPTKHLTEFWDEVYDLLLEKTVKKVETHVFEGEVSIYWAGTIIRMDLKPRVEA